MISLKERLKNYGRYFVNFFDNCPITTITIVLLTCFIAFVVIDNGIFDLFDTSVEHPLISEKLMNQIVSFNFCFAVSAFFIESLVNRKKRKKTFIFSIIAVFIISAVLVATIFNLEDAINELRHSDVVNIQSNEAQIAKLENTQDLVTKITVTYIISISLIALYKRFKDSEYSLEEYLIKLVINIFKISLIYGIVALGFVLICWAFIELLLDGEGYSILGRIEMLLLGLYYIPQLLYSLSNKEGEVGKFTRVIFKYVLEILLLCAFVIIYMYILKVFITREVPKNVIFRIVLALFAVGAPVWTLNSYFKDNDWIEKTNKKLPILFIPFILLQIYSIGIRIAEYGLTPSRYMCIMAIVFEAVYTIIYIFKKEKVYNMLFVLIGITIVSLLVPIINAEDLSIYDQAKTIKAYAADTDLSKYSDEQKDRLSGAYYYLRWSNKGKSIIDSTLTEEQKDEISNINTTKPYADDDYSYIHASNDNSKINIAGYSTLEFIDISEYKIERNIYEYFKNVKFYTDDEREYNVDLTDFISGLVNYKDSISSSRSYRMVDEYLENNKLIKIDSNNVLIVKYVSVSINMSTNIIDNFSLGAYLLTK